MDITRKTDYALRMLAMLVENEGALMSVRVAAEENEIPYSFARSIQHSLVHAGIIESLRGVHGGMRLKVDPAEVTIKQVVEAVIQEGLSYQEAARIYEVQGHDRIQSWERIYLEEGPEGLAVERRGRRSIGRQKKLPSKVEEDLLAEVQRLRAENAYLKNLQALVLEEERRQRKKRR